MSFRQIRDIRIEDLLGRKQVVTDLGGHKSLYSTAFYPAEEFWATYNGESYHLVKKAYDPDGRLLDLYAKTVGRR